MGIFKADYRPICEEVYQLLTLREQFMIKNYKHVHISNFWFLPCYFTIEDDLSPVAILDLNVLFRTTFSWQLQRIEIDEFNHEDILFSFILLVNYLGSYSFLLKKGMEIKCFLLHVVMHGTVKSMSPKITIIKEDVA